MKLATAALLAIPAVAAFAPSASFGVRNTALKMSEVETEKVRDI